MSHTQVCVILHPFRSRWIVITVYRHSKQFHNLLLGQRLEVFYDHGWSLSAKIQLATEPTYKLIWFVYQNFISLYVLFVSEVDMISNYIQHFFSFTVKLLTTKYHTRPSSDYSFYLTKMADKCSLWWVKCNILMEDYTVGLNSPNSEIKCYRVRPHFAIIRTLRQEFHYLP